MKYILPLSIKSCRLYFIMNYICENPIMDALSSYLIIVSFTCVILTSRLFSCLRLMNEKQ